MPRYIDAEPFGCISWKGIPEGYDDTFDSGVLYVADLIYDAPTVSAAEVRGVGEWIDYQQERWVYAKCSECGTVHDVRSTYCPSCGARMKGAEDEHD